MERFKKFGTLGGVFTPSLLTILGVIMYLRLGWIVGHAGLIYTLAIILMAHVISITTGLSLSSIATDKKIKAGGIYYMLSRSLGLPIGGAIGATIYLATALSISLYLVGFAESFIAVDGIRNFLGLEPNINTYRIVGTVTVLILTIIAFISTKLAIRVQYFVLTAIVLSLASIFAGLFINTGFHPVAPSITASGTAPTLDVLFAVFFPAVTGFTVGVAMSGDLKNPKLAIPRGTLLAIFTGLIIYLGLAVSFAFFINRELLIEDSSFLMKIAFVPVLVIAGIWGATLSSALGGILGGPRIVQAMAHDKLAPGMLRKGFGISNEPRFAIILTFLIAQVGILIGDLNTIARIVSMFFITAYGFINLAFALESWASSDFRPSFKMPRWVAWLGFVASFVVMMQIDFVAMIIAFMLIWLVWFVMKSREQKLDPGDVWQSVWSNIIRQSLYKLNKKGIEERNWKPNIILFSGNPQTRPHLIELGKSLIANHGMLTLINLKKYQPGQKPQPRYTQNVQMELGEQHKGIFSREYFCHDFYDGIETLAETYGFAGVEPNTVLMGWAHQNADAHRFARLIKHIIALDLNIMLMDYDQDKGFGKRKTIDIWWRGSGNNGNLAINLVKFLWLSNQWKDSQTRLMIENNINDERENIYIFAQDVLDNLRVNAKITIINNEIEQRSFYNIIRSESSESDIIFLGLPDMEEGEETRFIEETHALCRDLSTVVLIKASTQFKRLNIGLNITHTRSLFSSVADNPQPQPETEIIWPQRPEAMIFMKKVYGDISNLNQEFRTKAFGKVLNQYAEIVDNAENRVKSTFSIIEKKITNNDTFQREENITTLFKLINNSFIRYEQILNDLNNNVIEEQQRNLELFFGGFSQSLNHFLDGIPKFLQVAIHSDDLQPAPDDSNSLRIYKWNKRFFAKGQAIEKIRIHKLITKYYPNTWQVAKQKTWVKFAGITMQYLEQQQKTFRQFRDGLHIIETALLKGTYTPELLEEEQQKATHVFSTLKEFLVQAEISLQNIITQENNSAIQHICSTLNQLNVNAAIPKCKPAQKLKSYQIKQMEFFPDTWKHHQAFRLNHNLLELTLNTVEYKLWHFMEITSEDLRKIPDHSIHATNRQVLEKMIQYCDTCQDAFARKKQFPAPEYTLETNRTTQRKIKEIEDFALARISSVINRLPSHTELLKHQAASEREMLLNSFHDTNEVEVSRLIHFILQSDLITPMQQILNDYTHDLINLEKEIWETDRLIRITITGDKEDPMPVPPVDFFSEQKLRILRTLKKLETIKVSLDDKLHSINTQTSRQLSIPVFLKTADNLKLFARKKDSQTQKESWVKIKLLSIQSILRKYLVRVWFDRSKRLVFAQKIRVQESEDLFPVSQLHALNEIVSVSEPILSKIPAYYQHLFLRKNNYFMDFWHGKPQELAEADKTISRHDNGFNGALLVKGEHNSGKTFFVNYICHEYLGSRPIYILQAPFAGSTSEKDFLSALQKATEKYSGMESILKSLPEKSVVVIEDLELWWEKTPGGTRIIELIGRLIEKYGKKILFLINVNSHAFNSINQLYDLSPFLLTTIDCFPFSAEELKNIILQRHQSGNISFVMNNSVRENEMRSWDYARLFNTYFNYTKGNVGLALQTWMACITNIKDDSLIIRKPQRPDTSVLSKLDAESLIFMVQFILHKRLSIEKIERIMLISPSQAKKMILQLKNTAIVTEPNPGIYMLNPNIHLFIRELLIEKELL